MTHSPDRRAGAAVLALAYELLGFALLVASLPFWLLRAIRHRGEVSERLGWGGGARCDRPVWIHAASLGELDAARALIGALHETRALPVILTVLSATARRRAREKAPELTPRSAPLDVWPARPWFFSRVRPRALVVLESEIWPGWFAAARRRQIPTVIVSGRITDPNWIRMMKWRGIGRTLLASSPCAVAAQSPTDAERFRTLGFDPVETTGNLKYSGPVHAPLPVSGPPQIWVIGSLRRGEEGVLDAVDAWPGRLVVVAPRHLRERAHWHARFSARARRLTTPKSAGFLLPESKSFMTLEERQHRRESVLAATEGRATILYVDVHGQLADWYALADLATVGGTFTPIGGHSLFEAARCSVPTSFGPSVVNVRDLADALIASGGGCRLAHPEGLRAWLASLEDPAARARAAIAAGETARAAAGARERTLAFLDRLGRADVFGAS